MTQKSNMWSWLVFYCFLMVGSAFSTVWAIQLLQYGSRGESVREVQTCLYELNYLSIAPTGYYGKSTMAAVKKFQADHGLKSDGKIGSQTLETLRRTRRDKTRVTLHTVVEGETLNDIAQNYRIPVAAIIAENNLTDPRVTVGQKLSIPIDGEVLAVSSRGRTREIQAISWDIIARLWDRGEIVKIIDLRTGQSFQARRHGGHFHSDTEPLTARDAQTMLNIYGGKWSWVRRAVAVQIGTQFVAASINGMPHGGYEIKDNHFKGHFCVHFLGSRLHKNGRMDGEHQQMVRTAAAFNSPLNEIIERPEGLPEVRN